MGTSSLSEGVVVVKTIERTIAGLLLRYQGRKMRVCRQNRRGSKDIAGGP